MANHQIRAFRAILIEDTIPFLEEYFRRKIAKGAFQVESSKQWYRDLSIANRDSMSLASGFGPVEVMFKGLLEQLLQFEQPDCFPDTFIFDSERLWALRSTLQGLINLEICWSVFESYVGRRQDGYLSASPHIYANFCARIWTLTEANEDAEVHDDEDDEEEGVSPWVKSIPNISLEIARFASAASSHGRMAPDHVIADIANTLEKHLSCESAKFAVFKHLLGEKLLTTTCAYAKTYMNMSPLTICEAQRQSAFSHLTTATSSSSSLHCSPSSSSSQVTQLSPSVPFSAWQCQQDIDRIGMRLAHIGVLHWRVWAPILYIEGLEEGLETDRLML